MKQIKVLSIIRFEVTRYITSKAFIVMSLLFPVMMSFLIYMTNYNKKKTYALTVINKTNVNIRLDSCEQYLPTNSLKTENAKHIFATDKSCDCVIVITSDTSSDTLNVIMYERKSLPQSALSKINGVISQAYADHMHGDSLTMLNEEAEALTVMEIKKLVGNKQDEDKDMAGCSELALLAVLLTYYIIFQFSGNILKSIAIEKHNKISEILLTSVRAEDIILGKIVAGYLLALIQMTIWISVLFFFILLLDYCVPSLGNQFIAITSEKLVKIPENISAFLLTDILCITGGYLMYSSMFAIIGAMSNPNTDTQQFLFILTTPLIITLIYVINHLGVCNSWMCFFTYFPLTSPIALMGRFYSGIGFWEVSLSLIMLYACAVVCLKVSSGLYIKGIITEKEKITLKTILSWIKQ